MARRVLSERPGSGGFERFRMRLRFAAAKVLAQTWLVVAVIVAIIGGVFAISSVSPAYAQSPAQKSTTATAKTVPAAPLDDIQTVAAPLTLPTVAPEQVQVSPVAPAAPVVAPPVTATASILTPELSAALKRLSAELEAHEKTVERVKDRYDALSNERAPLESLIIEAAGLGDAARPKLDDLRPQLDKLGKPPEKGAEPESPAVAAERARLANLIGQFDGVLKTTELIQVRSRQLINRIQELRHSLFARDLLRRMTSPLQPVIWKSVAAELPVMGRQLSTMAMQWWGRAQEHLWPLIGLGVLVAAIFLGGRGASSQLFHNRLGRARETPPGFIARAGTAAWVALLRLAPVAAASVIAFAGLDALEMINWQERALAETVLMGTLVASGVTALAVAILTPRYGLWRLIDLSDRCARSLLRLTRAIAFVFAADMVLKELIRMLYPPVSISVAQTFITNLAFAALLIGIVRTRLEPGPAPIATAASDTYINAGSIDAPAPRASAKTVPRYQPQWLKFPLLVLALSIIVASVFGYVALGRFIAAQVMLTGGCIVAFLLLHLGINDFANEPIDATRPFGRLLSEQIGLDEARRGQLSAMLTGLLNLVLAFIAVPTLALSWGFSRGDIVGWLNAALFGFEIGNFKISLARILIAIALFVGLLFATRMLQRWLTATVLAPTRMDSGIAHSIHTGVGYVGVGLAALFGISYAGLDVTNLAIVAGALSVGIGFGLQSIVNNFVSGLILLVERPVKVGDWINVKGQEGTVRRISVRATEVETNDRSSLIIPNSELITGIITNSTHRNSMGRLVIKVSAAYTADPDHVMSVLRGVAESNSSIMRLPPPLIALDNFGDHALEFSLRVLLPDINRTIETRSELHLAILRAFREHNIEMPNAQYDVNLRGLETVRSMAMAAE
jgi:potassium-dependent mechanosensitive channel